MVPCLHHRYSSHDCMLLGVALYAHNLNCHTAPAIQALKMYACNGLSVLCTIMYLSIPFCDIHVLIFPPYSFTYYTPIRCSSIGNKLTASRVNSHKAPVHTITSRTRGMGKGLKAAQPLHFPRGFYVSRAAFALAIGARILHLLRGF